MSDQPLAARSLTEARLFLFVTPCPHCGHGPLRGGAPCRADRSADGAVVMVEARCDACQSSKTYTFQLPETTLPERRCRQTGETAAVSEVPAINTTDEPSRILDPGQWIVLYRVLTEQAGTETDRKKARNLKIQAGQCLTEALKFYDDPENDLPPSEALFCKASRDRFSKAPDQFSRRRLIELRAQLPTPSGMRSWRRPAGRQTPPAKKKRW